MELTATLLATIVGVAGLIRFFTGKATMHLFLGVGFLGAALFDAEHLVVTYSFSTPSLAALAGQLWSWNASRTFLSVMMVACSWALWRERRLGQADREPVDTTYVWLVLLTLFAFLILSFVPVIRVYRPDALFGRPDELIAGVLFLIALMGFLALANWRTCEIEHWLVLSLLISFVGQVLVMSRSTALFDSMFNVAHAVKIVSYICVLVGLYADYYMLTTGIQRRNMELTIATESLRREAAERKATQQEASTAHRALEACAVELEKSRVAAMNVMQDLEAANRELVRQSRQIGRINVELGRSNEDLKQFAYVASHDLQEPLRKVTAFCQLLSDEYGERLDDNARTYIQYAVDGALRMKTLVQDLLVYSRVEMQGKPLEPTDADEACAEAVENLALAIDEAAAEITRDPLPVVQADHTQLVCLFQNLLGNSIKYRGPHLAQIHVSAEDAGEQWLFRVRDNGIGIEPQYHERIFVIFQRLHGRDEYFGNRNWPGRLQANCRTGRGTHLG